jgi:hypothetical protein
MAFPVQPMEYEAEEGVTHTYTKDGIHYSAELFGQGVRSLL